MKSATDTKDQNSNSKAKKSSNTLVYIGTIVILVLTIIAFVLIPSVSTPSNSGNASNFIFGYWKNKPIQYAYQNAFFNEVARIKQYYEQMGYNINSNPYFGFQIYNQAYQNVVVMTAIQEIAESYGFSASKDYINKKVTESSAFQENGKFSLRLYQNSSYATKLAIYKEIEENLIRGRFLNTLFAIQNSSKEIEFIKKIGQKTREIEYVSLPLSSYPDSEKLAFAAAHPEPFRKIKLSRITFSGSESEAKNIVAQLESGKLDFAQAAKQYSVDAYKESGGAMGLKYYWELRADFKDIKQLDELFTFKAGTISTVIPSSTGTFLIFKVDEAMQDPNPSAPDFIKSITDYMNSYERGTMETWLLNKAKLLVQNAMQGSLETLAKAEKLVIKKTKPFPLNYGNALNTQYFPLLGTLDTTDTPELAQAETNEEFLLQVWSVAPGAIGEPMLLGNNVIIFRVKTETVQEADALAMLDTFYTSVIQQNIQTDLINWILANPNHKNNFYKTYTKLFKLNN